MVDYPKLFLENFEIVDVSANRVPFDIYDTHRKGQKLIADMMGAEEGPFRAVVLKARKMGVSSTVLGVFTLDFIARPNSVSVVIAHEEDATAKLLDKVRVYLDSYAKKHGKEKFPLSQDSKKMLRNAENGAVFYMGTAGQKGLLRGDTVHNLLFSEVAFYNLTTDKVNAIITGATSAVAYAPKTRIIFETTANGFNHFSERWENANLPGSIYKPIFLGADMFYNAEELMVKRQETNDDALFRQEFPLTPEEAFKTSGDIFFDKETCEWMLKKVCKSPIKTGNLDRNGNFFNV